MLCVRQLSQTSKMYKGNRLTPVTRLMKGHERNFGLCQTFQNPKKNLENHKPRYFKPDPDFIEDMRRKGIQEQKNVEELKELAQVGEGIDKQVMEPEVPVRPPRNQKYELEESFSPFRFVYPEFLPDPKLDWRNRIREKLERIDMLRRRSNIEIPEFYVGSIMKVSVSDRFAVGKVNEFVGLCIEREGCGLRANFTLRNVIDGQGVEIRYQMYNPIIQSIQVLKLEKRLDESLRYLRDCPLEYSIIPIDMQPELRNPDAPVPINRTLVRIKPKPWTVKWHLYGLRGIENLYEQVNENWELTRWHRQRIIAGTESNEFDLMKIYRETIPADEQTEIFSEISPQLAKLTQTLKKQKKKRTFAKPQKIA